MVWPLQYSPNQVFQGQAVFQVIQGKNGKWDKQCQIVKTLENRQYRIRLFGSGRITLRNRRFIRQCFHTSPNHSTLIADAIIQSEETHGMTGGERTSIEGQTYQSQDPQQDLETPTETPIEPPISSPPARATETDTAPTLSRKMLLALRNLLPYNKPGKKGLAGEGRKVTFQFDGTIIELLSHTILDYILELY